ncbi:non-specific lipid-transfer protein 1-like isoform X1 [Triticum dicoccoides]|uniref:non-specific lipid-transfer protein 1-like isoform X1 n=1 Tax=Triticum dicoccoides TaxID=85692 RepID=UPI00188F0C0E|nr:non-specific lipid-transfer protein 1-like isoform X1 [Triticum dicoccoides]
MAPAWIRGARAVAPAVLLVAALLVALAPRGASAALSCSTVYNELMPCLGYVQSGGAVPRACCSGIKTLVSRARATPDRRAACACLKTVAAAAAGGPYLGRAAGLPGRCGVQPPFKIDPNVNCNAYVTPKQKA